MKKHFRQQATSLLLLHLTLFFFPGCSSPDPGSPTKNKTPNEASDATRTGHGELSNQDFDRVEYQTSLGTVETFSILPSAIDRYRTKASEYKLNEIPTALSYGSVYQIEGGSFEGAMVVTPRVLLKASLSSRRMHLEDDGEGQLSAQVSLALIDGLSSQISTGMGVYETPAAFTIPEKRQLLTEVEKQTGRKPAFISAIPCPTDVKISISGSQEYPLTFSTKLKTCPLNTFFPTTFKTTKQNWGFLQRAFLNGVPTELKMTFSLANPVVTQYSDLKLHRSEVKRVIAESLAENDRFFSREEVEQSFSHLIRRIEKDFHISYPITAYSRIRDELLGQFFPRGSTTQCPENMAECYFRGGDSEGSATVQSFYLYREEHLGDAVELHSHAPMSDTSADQGAFWLKADSHDATVAPEVGKINNLLRSVRERELLEFRINQFQKTAASFPVPRTQHTDKNICTDPYTRCDQGRWFCTSQQFITREKKVCKVWKGDTCIEWMNVSEQVSYCDVYKAPSRKPKLPYRITRHRDIDSFDYSAGETARIYDWSCDKSSGNHCEADKWQNQWERITEYSYPFLANAYTTNPITEPELKRIIGGLRIQFSWSVQGKTQLQECALSDMGVNVIPPDRFLVSLSNSALCHPFIKENRRAGFEPNISLVNQVAVSSEFQCGTLWENFQGKRKYTCRLPDGRSTEKLSTVSADDAAEKRGERTGIFAQFYPRTQIQGTLRVVGGYFESLIGELL